MVEHGDDTDFTTVVVEDIPFWPYLDHLYFDFVCMCVGVPCGSGILQLGFN